MALCVAVKMGVAVTAEEAVGASAVGLCVALPPELLAVGAAGVAVVLAVAAAGLAVGGPGEVLPVVLG